MSSSNLEKQTQQDRVSTIELGRRLHSISPRWTKPPTPLPSILIHGLVFTAWLILLTNAFFGRGIFAWSVGIVYILYDTALLLFTFSKTLPLRKSCPRTITSRPSPTVTVIIAAYNEAPVLIATIEALLLQDHPPDMIIVADDGSTDETASILAAHYNLQAPEVGTISAIEILKVTSSLCWLRVPHGEKARALNEAITYVTTDLFMTVDADTILAPHAITTMLDAFSADKNLVAATGVLSPVCDNTSSGRLLQWFQAYEYVRNFLSRYAWARMNSLLLISGALAGFRLDAVLSVGGFDPDCMVEDYELIHRLRRYGYDHQLEWHTSVLGGALGQTSAPSTIVSFLRQRRRWFGGFLQTQNWYKDMAGAARYGDVGIWMLPVKAADTMQPIYGLSAFILLVWYLVTGRLALLIPVGGLIIGKIVIDLMFHTWSIFLYRRWVGGHTKVNFGLAILAAIVEPFSFQLFRHLGACWGWQAFLTRRKIWGIPGRSTTQTARPH
jgi:cellulose synthase/poly-beta-1,6-N-acetylglucosamine synthase-like glycosyltransferase